MKLLITFSCIYLALMAGSAAAQQQTTPAKVCEEATTVFHDVSKIGRKDRAAANMTRRHRDMAEDGWRFVDKEIYIENGDMEGFFITYVRAVPCPSTTG